MSQYIKESTCLDNLLDLFFTNDPLLVIRVRQMMNTKLSDHNTLVISLSYGMTEKEDKKVNQADTEIPEYDLKNGDAEDWLRFNMLIKDINWEEMFRDKSVDEMSEILLKKCEDNVKKIFRGNDGKEEPILSPETLSQEVLAETSVADDDGAQCGKYEKKFKSKNKIPHVIRNLFRKKRKATQGIFTTRSAKKCLTLRRKVQFIEEKLA